MLLAEVQYIYLRDINIERKYQQLVHMLISLLLTIVLKYTMGVTAYTACTDDSSISGRNMISGHLLYDYWP